ncbi:RDD family protein [compost metagenome]
MQMGVLLLVPAIYEFIFLALMQATPGKWMMGLKVVPCNDPNAKLEFGHCLLRPLTGRLSLLLSWAIYAVAFFRYDRTHLCDWVAETRVIQFKPRAARTRLRWVLGTLFVISHGYEGLRSASHTLQQINWSEGKVDLRSLIPTRSNSMGAEFEFDPNGDDEE